MSALYKDWKPPTKVVPGISFLKWLDWAHAADAEEKGPEDPHYYLMLGTPPLNVLMKHQLGKRASDGLPAYAHFVNSDLGIFTPSTENFFVTNVMANKGIQCRFGMRGVIAEAHYDGGRNMV